MSRARVWYRNGAALVARKTSARATTMPGSAKAAYDEPSTTPPTGDR
jgi:hypothetical protein